MKGFQDKVGKCQHIKTKYRACKHAPSAEEFVAITKIINFLLNFKNQYGDVSFPIKESIDKILQDRISLTKQNKSILWQKIIQAKIQNQANLLALEGKVQTSFKLQTLQKGVKLGDSTNNEAKASALYFPVLFGKGFSRKDLTPINSTLNYGYAII